MTAATIPEETWADDSRDDEQETSRYFELAFGGFQLKPGGFIPSVAARVALKGQAKLRAHEAEWRTPERHIPGKLDEVRDGNDNLSTVRFQHPELMLAALSIQSELGIEPTSEERGIATVVAHDLRLFMREMGIELQEVQSAPPSVLE